MKLLVTGVSGFLGLNAALQLRDRFELTGCYHAHPLTMSGVCTVRCDLTQADEIESLVDDSRPEIIVHAAGLTNVDQCERDPALAVRLNVAAARTVARQAQRIGARLLHISTDHLFDGTRPMRSETDPTSPLNVYAQTKWKAEREVQAACPGALIVRTNFFGWGSPVRESFSDWVLHGLQQSDQLRMFADVFFTPLLVNDLIDRAVALLERDGSGVVNIVGADRLSKYAFGLRLARTFGFSEDQILAVETSTVSLNAVRPRDMSLSSLRAEELLGSPMPSVDAGLARLQQLGAGGWPQKLARAVVAAS